jgi:hypothetical protein
MRKLLIAIPLVILATAVFGFIVMNLWNWLVPAVFGGKIITFWQALGVLVMSRILFGGFFGRRPMRFVHRWDQLTPEEREKFRAGLRRRGCGPRPDFHEPGNVQA